MKDNQSGFTYPLTLSCLVVFLLFFSLMTEQLLTERKLVHESRRIFQEEYYMLTSAKKIENMLQSGESITVTGSFQYIYGNMDFHPEAPSGNVQKVTFSFHFKTGETSIGYGFYDINSKKMIKWIEKN